MNASAVKAEIKAWERDFKALNGCDPTIQDIKSRPEIADKYRLYKKLSKQTEKPALPTPEPPSTPKRPHSRSQQSLPSLLAHPREIATTAPLSSFNPFSPQKNKVYASDRHIRSPSNVFVSDHGPASPFLALNLPKASRSSITPPRSPQVATSALSRARKRLRGDSVSPSPAKAKRRQIGSNSHPTFAKSVTDFSGSDEDESRDSEKTVFVSDSPVKVPAGAKLFKVLFQETYSAADAGPKKVKGKAPSIQHENNYTNAPKSVFNDDATPTLDNEGKRLRMTSHRATSFKANVSTTNRVTQTSQQEVLADNETKTEKRSLSDTEAETLDGLSSGSALLIPPSPPQPDASTYRSHHLPNAKGKGKAMPSAHKKAKTTASKGDRSEGDTDSSEIHVKITSRKQRRRRPSSEAEYNPYLDTDPSAADPSLAPRDSEVSAINDDVAESLEIILPDKLRDILALEATESQVRHSLEEQLVRGLVSGLRTGHYDPIRGGEIWDIGEDTAGHDEKNHGRCVEDEDDWEGEPVPWEIGEL